MGAIVIVDELADAVVETAGEPRLPGLLDRGERLRPGLALRRLESHDELSVADEDRRQRGDRGGSRQAAGAPQAAERPPRGAG